MNLIEKLKSIRHKYHLETTQTFKFTKDIFSKLEFRKEDFEKLKNKEIFKRIAKKMEDGRKKKSKIKLSKKESEYFIKKQTAWLSSIHTRSLLNMTHIYLISLFEAFNKGFFLELFVAKPQIMKCEKEIKYNEIINIKSIKKLHRHLASKEINEISYQDIDKLSKYIKDKFNVNIKTNFKKWNNLRENYYRRNIIVHNKGIMSEIYVKKLNLDEKDRGRKIENDLEYIETCFKNIHSYITFIAEAMMKKFKLE